MRLKKGFNAAKALLALQYAQNFERRRSVYLSVCSNEIFSVLVLCLFKKAGSNDTGRRTVGLNLTNVVTYGIKQC